MMAIFIDLESVRFTRPGGRPRGSLAEHDARKPRFFRKRFLEKHIPRLGIYRLAGFVDFKRLPDRSLQVLTGCVTQDSTNSRVLARRPQILVLALPALAATPSLAECLAG
jgi:hypothetical protein